MSGSLSALYLSDPQAAAALRRRALAESLMSQALQADQPLRSPWQVAGKIGQSLLGALLTRKADDELTRLGEERRRESADFLAMALGAMGGRQAGAGAPAVPAPPAAPGAAAAPRGAAPAVPEHIRPIVERAAAEHNVPVPLLAAMLARESGFDPNAVGRSGEIGIAQVLPSTARDPGFGVPPISPEELRDPARAIPWAARYAAARARAIGADLNDPAQAARGIAEYNGRGPAARAYGQAVAQAAGLGGGGGQISAPAPVPGGTANLGALALSAALSRNPEIQRLAPLLAQMAGREDRITTAGPGQFILRNGQVVGQVPLDPSQEPTVTVRRPDGSEIILPRSQAGGMVSAPPVAPRPQLLPPDVFEQQERLRRAQAPPPAETALSRELGQRAGVAVAEGAEAAQQAALAVQNAERIEQLLRSGAITGTGAEWRLKAARALAQIGLIPPDQVSNTEQLMTALSRQTLALAQQLRGPISERELAFLQAGAGGSIELSEQGLREIARIQRQIAQGAIERFNRLAGTLQQNPELPSTVREAFRPVEAPPAEPVPPARPLISPPTGERQGAPVLPQQPPPSGAPLRRNNEDVRARANAALQEARRRLGPQATDDQIVEEARRILQGMGQ